MHSSKAKTSFQRQLRQFKVALVTDAELAFSDGRENTLLAFDAWIYEGKHSKVSCEVYIDYELWDKRMELFRAGHRLVLVAWTDGVSPILYATDAWFDRHRPG